MKKLIPRLALLFLPMALLYLYELLIPWDAFAFRTWEAVSVSTRIYDQVRVGPMRMPLKTTLTGPWLPNFSALKMETGDLGHHTSFGLARQVLWETDDDGFRNTPGGPPPSVVVVGDSETVGTGLSQHEILTEVLRREHGIAAYAFAPSELQEYISSPRWKANPPAHVIYERIERVARDKLAPPRENEPPLHGKLASHGIQRIETALTRMDHLASISYLRKTLNGRNPPIERRGVLFLQGEDAGPEPTSAEIESSVKSLKAYDHILRKRGTRLAVLVVPDKESTYADYFPNLPPRTFISRYRAAVQNAGLVWIELESDFLESRRQGQEPQQGDDTHWSAHGVRLAARNLAQWIRSSPAAP